ncbi:hypothetical protein D3C84_951340 [compost metagenome]
MSHTWLDRGQRAGYRMSQHCSRPHLPSQHIEEGRFRRFLLVTQQVGIEHRTMKGHETGITTDRQMQRGDVAVADKRLGVVTQQIKINAIEQPGRAVTTPQADDGIHLTVGERSMQIAKSHLVATGQVAVFFVDPGKHFQ